MDAIIKHLHNEKIPEDLIGKVLAFREKYPTTVPDRIPSPAYFYYGTEIWTEALTALLAGENILLVGPKATGKNVLAENLSAALGRPQWDISFYLNVDAASLIGTDTFKNGEVQFRKGPVYRCAECGGFGVLDEINMAKNESMAVLHAILDFRRVIDVPGYDRIKIPQESRFIATMNYGYAGTRELNEALASRFMVIDMPVISGENLKKLMVGHFPAMRGEAAALFAELFDDIRTKCENSEISTKALDLRGLIGAIGLIQNGLKTKKALEIGMINKSFDIYEKKILSDLVTVRFSESHGFEDVFDQV